MCVHIGMWGFGSGTVYLTMHVAITGKLQGLYSVSRSHTWHLARCATLTWWKTKCKYQYYQNVILMNWLNRFHKCKCRKEDKHNKCKSESGHPLEATPLPRAHLENGFVEQSIPIKRGMFILRRIQADMCEVIRQASCVLIKPL